MQELSRININPDFSLFLLVIAVVVYAILLGQEKVKTLALSAYVGIVLAREAGPAASAWLSQQGWDLNGSLGTGIVQLIFFALPLLTLEIGKRGRKQRSHNRMLMTLLIAITTAFLIIAYGTEFIGEAGIKDFLDQSTLATQIYGLKLLWTAAVPLLIIAQSFMRHHE